MLLWSDDKLRLLLRVSQSVIQSYIGAVDSSTAVFPAPLHHVRWRALRRRLPATPSHSDKSRCQPKTLSTYHRQYSVFPCPSPSSEHLHLKMPPPTPPWQRAADVDRPYAQQQ